MERSQGVVSIKDNLEQRACDLALYIIENRATIRQAARQFGVSKSTVHKDIAERLEKEYGITVDKRKIQLDDPIRAYGKYDLDVKLYADIVGKLHVMVCN